MVCVDKITKENIWSVELICYLNWVSKKEKESLCNTEKTRLSDTEGLGNSS